MRLIDADALEKDYRSQFESVYKNIRDTVLPSDFYIERKAAYDKTLMKMEMKAFFKYLQGRPTIDAVEVVRCRDCGISEDAPIGEGYLYCNRTCMVVSENDYCSYGERKDGCGGAQNEHI